MWSPTAAQAPAELQETPVNRPCTMPCGPVGVGVGTTFQVVPVRASASVTSSPLENQWPTAVQSVPPDRQEAADSTLRPPGPAGSGVDWAVQADPFHSSASVPVVAPACRCPTAVQAVADVQDTPDNWPWFDPDGSGA